MSSGRLDYETKLLSTTIGWQINSAYGANKPARINESTLSHQFG